MERVCDVVVLGAGLSGLAAARHLIAERPELNVVVLEARDRVGGRTQSVTFHGDAIDIGGQWLGPHQPLMLKLVEDLGLQTKRQAWFEDHGSALDDSAPQQSAELSTSSGCAAAISLNSGCAVPFTPQEQQEMTVFIASIDQMASSLSLDRGNDAMAAGNPSASTSAAWDNLTARQYLEQSCLSRNCVREMLLYVQTVMAVDPSELSFLYFLRYVQLSGGVEQLGDGDGGAQSMRIAGGAQQVSELMAAQFTAAGGSICLDSEVLKVQRAHSPSHAFVVHTVNGSTLARRIIVAMPPPMWRSIEFEPPLPAPHADLAAGMFMGSAVKTVAVYADRFWTGDQPDSRLEECGPVANLFPSEYAGRPALVGLITGGSLTQ